MSTINPSPKSVVLESSVKPSCGCYSWLRIQNCPVPTTHLQDNKSLRSFRCVHSTRLGLIFFIFTNVSKIWSFPLHFQFCSFYFMGKTYITMDYPIFNCDCMATTQYQRIKDPEVCRWYERMAVEWLGLTEDSRTIGLGPHFNTVRFKFSKYLCQFWFNFLFWKAKVQLLKKDLITRSRK